MAQIYWKICRPDGSLLQLGHGASVADMEANAGAVEIGAADYQKEVAQLHALHELRRHHFARATSEAAKRAIHAATTEDDILKAAKAAWDD